MNNTENHLSLFSSRILIAVLAIITLITGGTIGFVLIENYGWLDAFFMTIITMSTVGYEEVKPLGPEGKIFTSILIIFSFSTFAYAISVITTYFVTGQFKNSLAQRRMMNTVNNLEGHTILCGYGRVGKMAARKLGGYKRDFVVLEIDSEKSEYVTSTENHICLHSDATKEQNLLEAGILKANSLITTLPHDADNLYVVLTARELNKDLTIITRASEKESIKKLKIAGANNVIMPDGVGGAHMASLVVNPDIMEFIDHVSIQGAADVNLEEIILDELSSFTGSLCLSDFRELYKHNLNVIGLKKERGEILVNPRKEIVIEKSDKLFVLGLPKDISTFRTEFH
ncbi:MAG: voltage-gated potassium channel [Flavobacteriales bacterium]|jgi:voltage-gated potassium channel